jgi:hypothetical protein
LRANYPTPDNSGFVTIINENDQVVSVPGGSKPIYEDGKLKELSQTVKVFAHPHDVCIDDDENMYVAQWNSNQVYPYKLLRVD